MKTITDDTLLQCPLCKETALALQWDAYTESKCYTRQLRRAYKSIVSKDALSKNKDYHYCCPYCDKYSKSNTLIVVKTDLDDLLI